MPSRSKTSILTSSLLNRSGRLEIAHRAALCRAKAGDGEDSVGGIAAPPGSWPGPFRRPVTPSADAASLPRDVGESASSGSGRAVRLSLRLTAERGWRMRLVAAYLRQSCQTFLVEALDRHIDRLVGNPANFGLQFLLHQMGARTE